MKYSREEVLQFVREEEVQFVQLVFCDVFGRQKNITILPEELPRAFDSGIAFDASAVDGFGDEARSDLSLRPDPDTLNMLPFRPEHGKVVRMFCNIFYPDGTPFDRDTRLLLKRAVEDAEKLGFTFYFGAEEEFYLFELDEKGRATRIPFDEAGYMSASPDDRCESIRREICLSLSQLGIRPESAHHEQGPGQCEIDFRYSDALTAADNAMTFQTVVKTVARRNGLHADFSPKPLQGHPGNGLHVNFSVKRGEEEVDLDPMIAGILEKIREMTVFLNPVPTSYERLGRNKAPRFISWSKENRSQLIRIPAADGEYKRAELRSPDPEANHYLAFALIIRACLYGIEKGLLLQAPANVNLFTADEKTTSDYQKLPEDLHEARACAVNSEFIRTYVPSSILEIYCRE